MYNSSGMQQHWCASQDTEDEKQAVKVQAEAQKSKLQHTVADLAAIKVRTCP